MASGRLNSVVLLLGLDLDVILYLGVDVSGYVNLVKLCVGVNSVAELTSRIDSRKSTETRHVTRMWPKRSDELLAGGSLYWVIKGVIQARQTIVGLEEAIGEDGIRRCAIRLDAGLMRTTGVPKRPFQGWRYLSPDHAPPDLHRAHKAETEIPFALSTALAEIGVL